MEKRPKIIGIGLNKTATSSLEAAMEMLGFSLEWSFAWMVVFFVLTMVFAFALKGKMGVQL